MPAKLFVIFQILLSATYINGHDCEAKAGRYATELESYLFSNFELLSQPNAQSLKGTIGHVDMTYLDLNIDGGVLLLTGRIFMQWTDDRTIWDEEKFGGLCILNNIVANSVWKPTLSLNNNLFVGIKYNNSCGPGLLKITSYGFLQWESSVNFLTRCEISSNTWPWDSQKCVLNFTIDTPQMYLTISKYIEKSPGVTPLWTIIDVEKEDGYPQVIFKLTLKMKSCRLQVVAFLTLTAASLVLLLSFLIPPVSRIKLASKVLSLLLLVIFLVVLMNLIPNFIIIAPNFLIGYVMILSIAGLSGCITVFLLRLARKSSHACHSSLITEFGNLKENKRDEEMKVILSEDITPADDECIAEESLSRKSYNEWVKIAVMIEYCLLAICAILVIFLIISLIT